MFDDRILSLQALPFLWPYGACALAAFLMGAFPFGLVLARLAGFGDLRRIGSGNIGATNALRTGSKALAAAVLVLDGGKGAGAVWLAMQAGGPDFAAIATVAAVAGHIFPPWLRFRGGKGVATLLGAVFALSWPAGAMAGAVWLAVAGASRISSLAGMAAALALPAALWLATRDPAYTQAAALAALLVIARHGGNLRRLLRGEEPRIGTGR